MEITPPSDSTVIKDNLAITAKQAGEILGLGRHPIERLISTGYIKPTLGEVEKLASRPTVSGLPVLRLGDPAWDGDRRIGHARNDDDDILQDAALGWWGGPIEAVCKTGWLATAVSGFAIAIFRINGVSDTRDDAGYTRAHFDGQLAARIHDLVEPEIDFTGKTTDKTLEEVARTVLGNRVPNPRGGPIAIV